MNKTVTVIIGLVLIAGSFYGGMKYDQSQAAAARSARIGQFAGQFGSAGGRGAGFAGARGGGSFITGQILSKDSQSITIQLTSTSTPSAGSAIVFISASTTISKTSMVPLSDLAVGQNVIVSGQKNPDGSVSANLIQLRQTNGQ
ncbi:MAG TPA: hypothetical protein VKU83_01820 [Puia sp.]|nr:hypothetical protein [Puia sp.]